MASTSAKVTKSLIDVLPTERMPVGALREGLVGASRARRPRRETCWRGSRRRAQVRALRETPLRSAAAARRMPAVAAYIGNGFRTARAAYKAVQSAMRPCLFFKVRWAGAREAMKSADGSTRG